MSRGFWGVGLLAVLLAVSLTVGQVMENSQKAVSDNLEQASRLVLSGDMQGGCDLARQAHSLWQKHWRPVAAVSDHGPMDEIDGLFAQLDAYCRADMAPEFAACCLRLSMLVGAISEAHALTWWNLL